MSELIFHHSPLSHHALANTGPLSIPHGALKHSFPKAFALVLPSSCPILHLVGLSPNSHLGSGVTFLERLPLTVYLIKSQLPALVTLPCLVLWLALMIYLSVNLRVALGMWAGQGMGPVLTCTVPVASTVLDTQWTRDNICGMDERMNAWTEQCLSDQRLVVRHTFYYCRSYKIKRDTLCMLLCTKAKELQFCHLDSALVPGFFSCSFSGSGHPISHDAVARVEEWYSRWYLTKIPQAETLFPHMLATSVLWKTLFI